MDNVIKQDIIIVNENDEIIGYKKRGTILENDIYRVAALIIKNSKGEFLLAQRSFTKKNNPGQWSSSVAGTLEKGEDYDSNIIKEIGEEIGIYDIEIKKIFKQKITGKHNFFCQFYISYLDKNIDEFIIQKEEVENIRWFTLKEILKGEYNGNTISKAIINNLDNFK